MIRGRRYLLNLRFVRNNAAVAKLNFTVSFLSRIDNGFFQEMQCVRVLYESQNITVLHELQHIRVLQSLQ
jgi:hypothetical protein